MFAFAPKPKEPEAPPKAKAPNQPPSQAVPRAKVLRYKAGDALPDPTDPAVSVALDRAGAGETLPPEITAELEQNQGLDFSHVRLHRDSAADSAARALSARAFTVGEDIYFARGAFSSGDPRGRTLLAHELTHVLQYQMGRIAAPSDRSVSDPGSALEREAHAVSSLSEVGRDASRPTSAPATAIRPTAGAIFRSEELIEVGQPGEIWDRTSTVPLMDNHYQQATKPKLIVNVPHNTPVTVIGHVHLGGGDSGKVVSYKVTLGQDVGEHKKDTPGFIIETRMVRRPGAAGAKAGVGASTTSKIEAKPPAKHVASRKAKVTQPTTISKAPRGDAANVLGGGNVLRPPAMLEVTGAEIPIAGDPQKRSWVPITISDGEAKGKPGFVLSDHVEIEAIKATEAEAPKDEPKEEDDTKTQELLALYLKYVDAAGKAKDFFRNIRLPGGRERAKKFRETNADAFKDLVKDLKAAGYDDVIEPSEEGRLEPMSPRFEKEVIADRLTSFETTAKKLGNDALDQYDQQLTTEAKRYEDASVANALATGLGAMKADYAQAKKPMKSSYVALGEYVGDQTIRAEAQKRVDAGISALAKDHPLIANKDFPLNVVMSQDASDVRSTMQSYIEDRQKDVARARDLLKDSEKIYHLDKLMEATRNKLGITAGSLDDIIIQHHMAKMAALDKEFEFAVFTLNIAIGIATLGGSTLALGAAAVVSGSQATKEVIDYRNKAAAFGAKLSTVEPELLWAVIAVVTAGLDIAFATASILPKVADAIRAFNAGRNLEKFEATLKALANENEITEEVMKALLDSAKAEPATRALMTSLLQRIADAELLKVLLQRARSAKRLDALLRKTNGDALRLQKLLMLHDAEALEQMSGEEIAKILLGDCFVPGTLVWTPEGPRAIETLTVGDEVQAYDLAEGVVRRQSVLHTFERSVAMLLDLDIGGTTISCSAEHPFWLRDEELWRKAGELEEGDVLLTAQGEAVTVASIVRRTGQFTVHNIEVDGLNNYFVGPGGVLVHNKSAMIAGEFATRLKKDLLTTVADPAKVPQLLEKVKDIHPVDLKKLVSELSIAKIEALSGEALENFARLDPAALGKFAKFDTEVMEKFGKLRFPNMLDRYAELSEEALKKLSRLDKSTLEKFAGWCEGIEDWRADNLKNIAKQTDETIDFLATLKPQPKSKAANAAAKFEGVRLNADPWTHSIDRKTIMHVLERHHPDYWLGQVKDKQSFLPRNMTVDDIVDVIKDVFTQNRERIIANNNKGITYKTYGGTSHGFSWQLGTNKGRTGQLFPLLPGAEAK